MRFYAVSSVAMIDFVAVHPYLIGNIPVLIILLIIAMKCWSVGQGRTAVMSGLICIPFSLVGLLHQGSYWTPLRWGGVPLGIEDLILCMNSGMMVWLLATVPFFRRITVPEYRQQVLFRYTLFLAAGGAAFLALLRAGRPVMDGTLEIMGAAAFCLLVFRRDRWPLAAAGAAFFPPVYLAVVRVQFALWPEYVHGWGTTTIWGSPVAGVPAGEIAWAFAFGALWPLIVASVFDARCSLPERVTPSRRAEHPTDA